MTIDEFNSTRWGAGMRVHCKSMNLMFVSQVAYVVAVNFDQCLIATASESDNGRMEEWSWWRCENCELVDE